jgi:hypothetical protein
MAKANPVSTIKDNAFGATIRLASPGDGLYLVIGRDESLSTKIRSVGGKLFLRLSPKKLLVHLPSEQFLALQHHPSILLIGRVEIDLKRFARFTTTINSGGNKK